MFRMGSWLTTKPKPNASTRSLNSLDEPQYLEDALRAATHIMNDDVEAAEAGLSKGNSSFHKLGKGVVTFLRATLGFEQEVMREASERLTDAEATALNDQRRAQREVTSYHSSIYPPGSEFALCHAQSQLMSAVVGVLNESLTESIKGFYKLRKAFITLDGLLEAENRYMRGRSVTSLGSTGSKSIDAPVMPGGFGDDGTTATDDRLRAAQDNKGKNTIVKEGVPAPARRGEEADDDDAFYDADETPKTSSASIGNSGLSESGLAQQMTDLSLHHHQMASTPTVIAPSNHMTLDQDPNSDAFSDPIDIFIHSGSNLCFGLLLLMISMIPPAFGRLLYIIGFRGDRERGLKMLWQASKFHNINGAMAGLTLLGYYNGVVGFCDILPDATEDTVDGYPRQRCVDLLVEMRDRYPMSRLWMLEEARMQAANRNLERAVELLSGDVRSQLKQVEALAIFEKSLDAMFLHDYDLTSESFLKSVGLNNWSHALYYYIAGGAQVELYRQWKGSEPSKAKHHATQATTLLKKVPLHTGKKKFMAKQLPFDTYVFRKIQKWETRAKEWGVDLVDAVGVSPIEEMLYFWNGYKRMRPAHLETSLQKLSWSNSLTTNPLWSRENLDEYAILAFLRAVTLRHLGDFSGARKTLHDEILVHDKALFKGHLRDDWTAPCANYEMAVICWMERGEMGEAEKKGSREEELVKECAEWLDRAAKWESYELDARIGLKVTSAQDTLKKHRLAMASTS
ncbi:MAG: Mitochondrial outer membrane protein iml2 [Caeruleum heppii]|nr:MAG: Mitochondrial outer membrane protein iml2 [Caeruleum heppii]